MYIKEYNDILWKWQEIQRPDISWFTYYHVYDCGNQKFRAPNQLNEINIFCGDTELDCGLRQYAVDGVSDWVAKLANSNRDKKFICILDQGEHAHMHNKPDNFSYFNRKFHIGKYNFYNNFPPYPAKNKKNKWFYCPMGRGDFARTHVFNLIMDYNLNNKGYLSYLCTGWPNREPSIDKYNETNYKKIYDYGNLIPFNNFEDTILDNNQRLLGNWEIMKDCLFGISVETGVFSQQAWYNERVYNMLAGGLIPIVIGGFNSTSGLENLGFCVPDYTNWRLYDNLYANTILNGHYKTGTPYEDIDKSAYIIKGLNNIIKQNNINEIYEDWFPKSVYNYNHFMNTLPDLYKKEEQIIIKWLLFETGKHFDPKFDYLIDYNQN